MEEDLEEEDLELLEENTGTRIFRPNKLTRLRRGREAESPMDEDEDEPAREAEDQFSDEDDLGEQAKAPENIWEDTQQQYDDDEFSDDFIDDDLDEAGAPGVGEEEREARRRARLEERKERRKALSRPDMVGIDAK